MASEDFFHEPFNVGDSVIKVTGDFSFSGVIVAIFKKLNGIAVRYVVEDSRGMLLILDYNQIEMDDGY